MTNYILRGHLGYNATKIADQLGDNWKTVDKASHVKNDAEWVFRWGNREVIPNGPKVINKASAMKETQNKGEFRHKCAGLSPKTWRGVNNIDGQEISQYLPVIVRPSHHSMSEDLYFCETLDEVNKAINKIGHDFYISQYIKKDRELRAFVFQGRILMMWEKETPNKKDKISWGCVDAGRLIYIPWSQWPKSAVEIAIKSFNKSALDFGAVDIMMKDDKAYFLEINTAPEVWDYYAERIAEAVKWMMNNTRQRLTTSDYSDWKKCGHPSLDASVKS